MKYIFILFALSSSAFAGNCRTDVFQQFPAWPDYNLPARSQELLVKRAPQVIGQWSSGFEIKTRDSFAYSTLWTPSLDEHAFISLKVSEINFESATVTFELHDELAICHELKMPITAVESDWMDFDGHDITIIAREVEAKTETIAMTPIEMDQTRQLSIKFLDGKAKFVNFSEYKSHKNPAVSFMNGLKAWTKVIYRFAYVESE